MHTKKFFDWITLKEKLHNNKIFSVPYVFVGEIWWASLGENIGYEINGKSRDFTRPVVIFKKLSHEFHLVIPITTKEKYGNWYVPFILKGKKMFACLNHIRTIDYRRLHSKVGELSKKDFGEINIGFRKLYI